MLEGDGALDQGEPFAVVFHIKASDSQRTAHRCSNIGICAAVARANKGDDLEWG